MFNFFFFNVSLVDTGNVKTRLGKGPRVCKLYQLYKFTHWLCIILSCLNRHDFSSFCISDNKQQNYWAISTETKKTKKTWWHRCSTACHSSSQSRQSALSFRSVTAPNVAMKENHLKLSSLHPPPQSYDNHGTRHTATGIMWWLFPRLRGFWENVPPFTLSKLRRLWQSVHWRVQCELVSWWFPSLSLDSGVAPTQTLLRSRSGIDVKCTHIATRRRRGRRQRRRRKLRQ